MAEVPLELHPAKAAGLDLALGSIGGGRGALLLPCGLSMMVRADACHLCSYLFFCYIGQVLPTWPTRMDIGVRFGERFSQSRGIATFAHLGFRPCASGCYRPFRGCGRCWEDGPQFHNLFYKTITRVTKLHECTKQSKKFLQISMTWPRNEETWIERCARWLGPGGSSSLGDAQLHFFVPH